ncbi:hypothetical protein FH972_015531 [Carpinus fangiana]|uniref:DUF679 domain-containing protein n=1 Tax=Carpinus fangiana TaxID=176857 RepID=A0A5N6RDM6_9ROSI|nr:hypothetical protein FH972_015531 [Carpinus fangiana]
MAMAANNSSSQTTIKDKTLSGVGNLVRLLPTGTVFLYQFLSPVLSNNGHCNTINKYLTAILVGLCGLSCFFSTFTDSYVGDDGQTHYGVATGKGLWPSPESKTVDLPTYKLRFSDFVHSFFAVIVFAALVLLDGNAVGCFYPASGSIEKTLLQVLPPAVGAVSSVVFMFFPSNRNGIGYPATASEPSQDSNSGRQVSVSTTKA